MACYIEWLRKLSESGGKGTVDNVDARALGRVADELERMKKVIDACDWHWPADDTSEDSCEVSPWDIIEYHCVEDGDIVEILRGGVVETMFCARLPPADDSDTDDDFEVCEATYEAAKAAIDAERTRRRGVE